MKPKKLFLLTCRIGASGLNGSSRCGEVERVDDFVIHIPGKHPKIQHRVPIITHSVHSVQRTWYMTFKVSTRIRTKPPQFEKKSVTPRKYRVIYRGPAFSGSYDLAPRPQPSPSPPHLLSVSSTGDTQENWENETTCWRERGEGEARSWIIRLQESLVLFKDVLLMNYACNRNSFEVEPRFASASKQWQRISVTWNRSKTQQFSSSVADPDLSFCRIRTRKDWITRQNSIFWQKCSVADR